MQERYRADYDGEFVILNTRVVDGEKIQDKEWIANPIENQHISSRAAIIGHGISRSDFKIKHIENHRGGLLGSKKLQTYGAQGCWQEIVCNFYVENNLELLPSLIESKYTEKTICYSSVKGCVQYPGEFYLIPYNQRLTSIATAMYIAAFDGHRELFLLGVDGTADSTSEIENASHVASICKVLAAYSNTKIVFVSNRNVSSEFRKYSNVQSMNYREWISYCDV